MGKRDTRRTGLVGARNFVRHNEARDNPLIELESKPIEEIVLWGRDHCTFLRYLSASAQVSYEYPLIDVEARFMILLSGRDKREGRGVEKLNKKGGRQPAMRLGASPVPGEGTSI